MVDSRSTPRTRAPAQKSDKKTDKSMLYSYSSKPEDINSRKRTEVKEENDTVKVLHDEVDMGELQLFNY